MMKTDNTINLYRIAVAWTLMFSQTSMADASVSASATVELERMDIRGEIIRPNMVGVLPEQGGMNDAAHLLQRVPGGNVNGLGPLSGIAQYPQPL
jgi:iron complex outermembrane recepter protein